VKILNKGIGKMGRKSTNSLRRWSEKALNSLFAEVSKE